MRKIVPKQEEYAVGSPKGMTKGKSKGEYPTIRMDLAHLPEAKNMKLGDMAHIGMHAKLTGLSQSRFDNSAQFEVHAIEHKKLQKMKDETDAEGAPYTSEEIDNKMK